MRPWLLLVFLPIASAEDPAAVNPGEWGFSVFLQFDTNGGGAWGEAKAGAMARFESLHTVGILPDPVGGGGRTKKPAPKVSQHEIRVVKGDDGKLVLQTRGRPSNERGEPGKWGKSSTSALPVIDTGAWKVERIGATTHRVGSRSVDATTYSVRFPDRSGDQAEEVWSVVVSAELGVLHAKQESGDQIEWSLVRTDVEFKVDGRKLLCRDYEFRWNPPALLKDIAVKQRRMFLSAEVPGRVVRQTYSGLVGTSTEENLISFAGR